MVVLLNTNIEKGLGIRGKLGRPNKLGTHWLAWTQLGDDFDQAGYYQKRPRKKGQIFVRMKHYWPDAGHTPQQLANRAVFASGVSAWHALTTLQKEGYNHAKYPPGLSGFCRFMREYLKANL